MSNSVPAALTDQPDLMVPRIVRCEQSTHFRSGMTCGRMRMRSKPTASSAAWMPPSQWKNQRRDGAEHRVVVGKRVVAARPVFPEGGGAVFEHPAPGGEGLAVGKGVGEVAAAVLRKFVQQDAGAEDAGGQARAVVGCGEVAPRAARRPPSGRLGRGAEAEREASARIAVPSADLAGFRRRGIALAQAVADSSAMASQRAASASRPTMRASRATRRAASMNIGVVSAGPRGSCQRLVIAEAVGDEAVLAVGRPRCRASGWRPAIVPRAAGGRRNAGRVARAAAGGPSPSRRRSSRCRRRARCR